MPAVVVNRFTLSYRGGRYYTFTPVPGEETVVVRFVGPKHNIITTMPANEARALWVRLLRKGYERF